MIMILLDWLRLCRGGSRDDAAHLLGRCSACGFGSHRLTEECQPHWFLPVAPVEGRIAAAMAENMVAIRNFVEGRKEAEKAEKAEKARVSSPWLISVAIGGRSDQLRAAGEAMAVGAGAASRGPSGVDSRC